MRHAFVARCRCLTAHGQLSVLSSRAACTKPTRGSAHLCASRRSSNAAEDTELKQAEHDESRMREALALAQQAAAAGEVPVGAVLELRGQVVATAHNQSDATGDPTAHAEMLCLRSGAAAVGWQELRDATLYVTLEPCPMCAGAVLQSRVGTLVYGAANTLLGADGSWVNLLRHGGAGGLRPHAFHPSMRIRHGVLAEESSALMKNFFKRRRSESDAQHQHNTKRGDGEDS